MRYGIFGGSFDPPHLGHLIAAQSVAIGCELDLVFWVPTGESYHKAPTTAAHHRFAMVEAAIASNPRFAVSEVDILRPGPTYSYDTVTDLEAQYPGSSFTLMMGDDAFATLGSWNRAAQLRERVSIAVVTRESGQTPQAQDASLRWIAIPHIAISSSECRDRVRSGSDIRYLVPESVGAYINEHSLYSENYEPGV